MRELYSNPLFGLFLTTGSFYIGSKLSAKFHTPVANPLLIAAAICIAVLKIFEIPYEDYMEGAEVVSMFLVPVTAMLGLAIYRQRKVLKEEFFPILIGCLMGSLLSMGSAVILCRAFFLRSNIIHSLLPKSVTTAIALDVSEQLGGIRSITLIAVIACGVLGAIIHPFIIKILRLKDPVATGVAFGTASHAIGTSKALEIGEIEGAVSGVAMGVAGICTVIIALFL